MCLLTFLFIYYIIYAKKRMEKRDKREGSDGSLGQWSSTFLAPGTSFMEDSFSTNCQRDGFRMIQVHYIYCALYYYYYISSTSANWGLLL